MKKLAKLGNFLAVIPVGVGYLMLGAEKVFAQNNEGFLPEWLTGIVGQLDSSSEASDYINNRIKLALTVLFVLVIIIAFVYSALAGIKLITSQGESGKMEEGKNAVKAILFGFAAMILAIAGIFVVFWLLGGSEGTLNINNIDLNVNS